MSTLSQFSGGAATRSIVNAFSSGGVSSAGNLNAGTSGNASREVLSGALTANTLKDLLSVSGSGQVPYLSAYSKDATSRTIRMVVIVDGTTVFDATSNAIAGTNNGILAAGYVGSSNAGTPSHPIRFNSSLLVRVASSLTETDKVAIAYYLT